MTKESPTQKRMIWFVLAFTLLFSACTPQITKEKSVTQTVEPSTKTPAPQITSTPSCVTTEIKLDDLVNGQEINGNTYHWSGEDQLLYFQTEDAWWAYSVLTGEVRQLTDAEIPATPTQAALQTALRPFLSEEDAVAKDWSGFSSLSPSATKLIYWKRPENAPAPTNTPDPDPIAVEDFGTIAFEEQEIYILQDGISEPLYLGKVNGLIRRIFWLHGEEQAIFEMAAFSPDYLLILDLSSKTVTSLLSKEEADGAPKFSVVAVSPEGEWVIYQRAMADHIFMVNTKTTLITPLETIRHSMGAWWLQDEKKILLISLADKSGFSAILYNMETKETVTLLSDLEFGFSDLLSISDTQALLTHTRSYPTSDFYLLKLCLR